MEDSAREAASLTLTAVDLQNTLDELDKLGNETMILHLTKTDIVKSVLS